MREPTQTNPAQDWLRLSPEDLALLWGVVDNHRLLNPRERWPRLERIQFDLEVMMRRHQRAQPSPAGEGT